MKVLLVDDHPLFLEGLRTMLTARDVEVVGVAQDGLDALAKARRLRPDVILMDISMPRCDGLEATRRIKAELHDVKIVMLTASLEDEDLFEAIKSGASGYLLKSLQGDEFFDSLAELTQGGAPLSKGLSAKVLAEFARLGRDIGTRGSGTTMQQTGNEGGNLTPMQTSVLSLVARGLTYKEVAARLHLGERTVKYHMEHILQRLRLGSRSEAIAYAERAGLTNANHSNGDVRPGR